MRLPRARRLGRRVSRRAPPARRDRRLTEAETTRNARGASERLARMEPHPQDDGASSCAGSSTALIVPHHDNTLRRQTVRSRRVRHISCPAGAAIIYCIDVHRLRVALRTPRRPGVISLPTKRKVDHLCDRSQGPCAPADRRIRCQQLGSGQCDASAASASAHRRGYPVRHPQAK